MIRSKLFATTLALALLPGVARAQRAAAQGRPAPAKAAARALTLRAFLAEVGQHNLELCAQRFALSIADAGIAAAKIFPDPSLTVGVSSVDVSGKGSPTVATVGLGVTIELGGKRGARVAAARADRRGAEADLDDFLRDLRASAASDFIDALKARMVLDRRRQTEKSLDRLVSINRERMRTGDVGQVALTQSRVEAERFRGEVALAEADVAASALTLSLHTGSAAPSATPVTPVGDLRMKPRVFSVDDLVAQAQANRPDLRSRRRAVEAAEARVSLARANRWVDVTLGASLQHALAARGAFEAPSYDALAATVSVPLPFSNVYRGELDEARASVAQRRHLAGAAERRVEVEVRTAFLRYAAAVKRLELYTGGLLTDAEQVLQATLYNYGRGGATLLEVLEAQRTQNDVFLAYVDALADHARALVSLEQAAGIWDIELP